MALLTTLGRTRCGDCGRGWCKMCEAHLSYSITLAWGQYIIRVSRCRCVTGLSQVENWLAVRARFRGTLQTHGSGGRGSAFGSTLKPITNSCCLAAPQFPPSFSLYSFHQSWQWDCSLHSALINNLQKKTTKLENWHTQSTLTVRLSFKLLSLSSSTVQPSSDTCT